MNRDNVRQVYDVFTRINRGDRLAHIGTVEAETVELAKLYASYTYNEEDWIDMYVVARDHLIVVQPLQPLFEKERR